MEVIGHLFERPTKGNNGKWNPIELEYDDVESFCEATSKVLRMTGNKDSDGKGIVIHKNGDKYMLDVFHVTYDTPNHTINLFPNDCRKLNNR